jgi:glycosyltransferase involved in cell wall biosynthesis
MIDKRPTVSVIIPCYNQGHFLDEAVASVLGQSYQDFEIIIVNDGSTETESISILKNYNKPKTIVAHTNNQGLAMARNHAIQLSNGKYILPLDADDKIGRTYLEKAVECLEANDNLGIVYCEAEFFGNKTGKWELPEYQFPDILLGNRIFCSGFFRKLDWQKTGGYNSKMIYGWEDYDFWLSILELEREVYRIPEVLFFYRSTAGSMAKRMDDEKQISSYAQIFHNHPDLYSKNIKTIFAELIDAKKRLEYSQSLEQRIAVMENSKFWKLREQWIRFKNFSNLKSKLKFFVRNTLFPPKRLKLADRLFRDRMGIEVGGPSPSSFSETGFLPIYPVVNNLDNCTFSSNTIWEGTLKAGLTYAYHPKKQLGNQFILDGTSLEGIPSDRYDFILSSHVLEHIANPILAMQEWLRILKPNGYIVLVLPNKKVTFDRYRPTTQFAHLLEDYQNHTTEADLTHLEEILELHDLTRDPAAGEFEAFKARSLQNFENRCLHHHVFDLNLVKDLIKYLELELLALEESTSMDILAIGQKVK